MDLSVLIVVFRTAWIVWIPLLVPNVNHLIIFMKENVISGLTIVQSLKMINPKILSSNQENPPDVLDVTMATM